MKTYKYQYVYKTTNTLTNQYVMGLRICYCSPLEDENFIIFKNPFAVSKSKLKKEIVEIYSDYMSTHQIHKLQKEIIDEHKTDPLFVY